MNRDEIEKLLAGVNRPEPGQLDYCAIADAALDLARTCLSLMAQLEDAKAAQALVVERAERAARQHISRVQINEPIWHEGQDWAADRIARAIRDLAPDDGVEALAALRDQVARSANDIEGFQELARENMRQWGVATSRAERAEAEAADLRARLAAAEAQVGALTATIEGLITVLDRNDKKGPIPDVEMMFCWLAAQEVRAAFRKIASKGGAK